jgi:hypothetical protein
LLVNGINNLLTQFYGICFHIPYINNLYTQVKTAVDIATELSSAKTAEGYQFS